MSLLRTTIRIREDIKTQVERIAFEEDKTFQQVFHEALERYIQERGKKKIKKIRSITHDIGKPLDNLTREDIYTLS